MFFDSYETCLRIKRLRNHMGMSRKELAFMLDVSYEHMCRIEKGLRTPSIDLLVEMSDIFDVSIDYLVLGREFRTADTKNSLLMAAEIILEVANEL